MRMLRTVYDHRGPVPQEVVKAVPFEKPVLAAGQVLLEVLAAPVNPADILALTGEYGRLPPLPATAGTEGVGRVAEHGPGVTAPAIGQTVLLPVGSGTWATHLVAKAASLTPLSNDADPLQLAMLAVNPPTASLLLSEHVALDSGEWVIQNAANSGVGSYLVQLARKRGLKTVSVVRRKAAVAGVRALGSDVVLVDGDDLAERVHATTAGAKIRLAVDAVAGPAADRLARCLAEGGMLVNYGRLSGEPLHLDAARFIYGNITVRGFWLVHWFRSSTREQQAALYADVARMVATGELHAAVDAVYDVSDVPAAVAAAASGGRAGKILIVPRHSN